MNTIDMPDTDVDAITRQVVAAAWYWRLGAPLHERHAEYLEREKSEEWASYRKLTVQVLAALTACGYGVTKEAA